MTLLCCTSFILLTITLNSKTSTKSKFCATANGKHPQGWPATSTTANNHASSHTICSSCRSRSGAKCTKHPFPITFTSTVDIGGSSIKSTASDVDSSVNNTVSFAVDIARSAIRRLFISQLNSSFCDESNAVVGFCIASAGRVVLFQSGIPSVIRSGAKFCRRPCSDIIATTCAVQKRCVAVRGWISLVVINRPF